VGRQREREKRARETSRCKDSEMEREREKTSERVREMGEETETEERDDRAGEYRGGHPSEGWNKGVSPQRWQKPWSTIAALVPPRPSRTTLCRGRYAILLVQNAANIAVAHSTVANEARGVSGADGRG